MIITISGKPGSGKDTIGNLLGKKLGLKVIKASLKKDAKKKGMDILDFEKKYAIKFKEYDIKLDAWQKKKVEKDGENCVLISMLSAYNIPHADLKIWLNCPLRERARRISKRDKIPLKRALEYVKERDMVFKNRIRKLYKIDFWDSKFYDLSIDTSKNNPKEVIGTILKRLKEVG